jgi:hypothetical protein
VHLLVQLLIQQNTSVEASVVRGRGVSELTAVERERRGQGMLSLVIALANERQVLQMPREILVMLACRGTAASRHALVSDACKARRRVDRLRGIRRVAHGLALLGGRRDNRSRERVDVDRLAAGHVDGITSGIGRQSAVLAGRRGGRRHRNLLRVGVIGNAEELLLLLLFESPHLVLEHPALKRTLTLVFHTLELDTL